jgi:hypothetical protein
LPGLSVSPGNVLLLVGGKPALIHFWSASCRMCKEAMSEVNGFRDVVARLSIQTFADVISSYFPPYQKGFLPGLSVSPGNVLQAWINREVTKEQLVGGKPALIHFWSASCRMCKEVSSYFPPYQKGFLPGLSVSPGNVLLFSLQRI